MTKYMLKISLYNINIKKVYTVTQSHQQQKHKGS
jgi:hypothetical protein